MRAPQLRLPAVGGELGRNLRVVQDWADQLQRAVVARLTALEAVEATTPIQPVFPIWAEENAALGTGAYEWAFGNGANSPNGSGIVVPMDCEAFAMGLCHNTAASATVRFQINGTNAGQVATSGQRSALATFATPYVVSAGDVIGFQTVTGSGGNPNTVVVWLRGT